MSTEPLTVESMTRFIQQLETRIAELESTLEQGAREKTSWEHDQKLLRLVADNVDDLIAIVDCHGRRIWNNRAYFELLGYAPDELQGSYSFLEIHPDDQMKVAAAFADTMQHGSSGRVEYRMQHKNGSWMTLESHSRAIYDSEHRIESIILIARDISARNLAEEERAKASRIETLSVVARGIAGEFNGIISEMSRYVAAARKTTPPGTPAAERLGEAERVALKSGDIMQRLSYIMNSEERPKREIAPAHLLQTAAAKAARNTLARCEFLLPQDLHPLLGEEDALRQLFEGIVVNAAQATKSHGVIRVLGENLTITEAKGAANGLSPGQYVAINILDQGEGISPAHRARAFDPYFTTKPGATGMGLTTSLAIAKQHGGNIWIQSTENVGTTVTVILPAALPQELKPSEPSAMSTQGESTPEQPKGTVLIMDDEPVVCEFAATAFSALGYTPTVTKDGARAIEAYAKARFKGHPYDVVFLDLLVPNGVGGIDAYKTILQMNPAARVILVSGSVDHPIMRNPSLHGVKTTMRKPYTKDNIQKALAALA